MKSRARTIFMAGVAAADPYHMVRRALEEEPVAPSLILAIGKAARRMAEAALSMTDAPCIVVTNHENAAPLDRATVYGAGHPVPDAAGAAAAQAVIDAVQASEGPVLVLMSGGGSALLPAPVAGISLDDKAEVNRLLLASGADIYAMNHVRQQLSRLKGGGLARMCKGPVLALILSDVIGDDLSTIASGPTVAPIGIHASAAQVLKDFNIWDRVPDSVRSHLQTPDKPAAAITARNRLIGSNRQSVAAMRAVAGPAHVLPQPVCGDVEEAARMICDAARPGITLWGGETTVTIKGTGLGGRNQELALRIAVEARARGWAKGWVALCGGTDGRDGPTDAAGGEVDGDTLARIGRVMPYLDNNDSYHALEKSGDLLKIGATGTNVADLGVLIRP